MRRAITTGDPALVADAVLSLGEAGRREVADGLPGHIGVARKAVTERDRRRGVWTDGEEWIEPMRVAGAGVLGGAAAVATWLYRRDFTRWRRPLDSGPLLRVIAARPPRWQADLAARLALRLRGSRAQARDDSVPLALELLRRSGAVPPDHDPLTVAWVSQPPDLEHDPLAQPPRAPVVRGRGRGPGAARGQRRPALLGCQPPHLARRAARRGRGQPARPGAAGRRLLEPVPARR
ncbi:hypothetical protein ACFSTC_40600 [Nonomuraea ferruginea]